MSITPRIKRRQFLAGAIAAAPAGAIKKGAPALIDAISPPR